jgi:hypothetical protein
MIKQPIKSTLFLLLHYDNKYLYQMNSHIDLSLLIINFFDRYKINKYCFKSNNYYLLMSLIDILVTI